MEVALRRIGNSTGIVIPRALLGEIGLAAGGKIELRVENGRFIGEPKRNPREGWAEAAAALGETTDEEQEWLDATLTDDSEWSW